MNHTSITAELNQLSVAIALLAHIDKSSCQHQDIPDIIEGIASIMLEECPTLGVLDKPLEPSAFISECHSEIWHTKLAGNLDWLSITLGHKIGGRVRAIHPQYFDIAWPL
jgi:hypothetical protein